MHLEFDRNDICTALFLKGLSGGIGREILKRYLPKITIDQVFSDSPKHYGPYQKYLTGVSKLVDPETSTFDQFAISLSTIGHNFVEICNDEDGDPDEYYDETGDTFHRPYGNWEPRQLSTVFCFTSTNDNALKVRDHLLEFGFTPHTEYPSEKYKTANSGKGSVVTLWSMQAEKFADRCEELFNHYVSIYGPDGSYVPEEINVETGDTPRAA